MTGQDQLPEDPGSVTEQLAGLREEVGRLSAAAQEIAELKARQRSFAALASQFADLRDSVSSTESKLLLRLKRLTATVNRALGEGKLKPPQAPYLGDLTDEEYAVLAGEVRDWVDGFLRLNYPGYVIADCWARHAEALWELATLHAEWRRCYADPENRSLEDAIRFHDRLLPGVVSRLAGAIRCTGGHCQAAATRPSRAAGRRGGGPNPR